MTIINETEYTRLFSLYDRECKRVEVYRSRALTKNKEKITEYKESLVRTYNDILNYLNPFISTPRSTDTVEIQNRIVTIFKRLKECFLLLKLEYTHDKSIHALIDIDNITESENSEASSAGTGIESESEQSNFSVGTIKQTTSTNSNNRNKLEKNKQST